MIILSWTVGISKSSIREELVVHVVVFYPKNSDVKTNLQRIQPNQFVRASGKFIYDVTNVDGVNTRFLKVLSIWSKRIWKKFFSGFNDFGAETENGPPHFRTFLF